MRFKGKLEEENLELLKIREKSPKKKNISADLGRCVIL